MIHDLLLERPDAAQRTDVCISGAGAAGIVLALELASRGKSVTLLEGGGATVEPASQSPYAGEIGALSHRGLQNGRVRALGGTTTLWGGQILELDSLDFEARPWIAESGWPFPKRELADGYRRALELEGLSPSELCDDAVWQRLGQATPSFGPLQSYLSRWCPEPNFAKLHRATLERSERIHVWLHANAVALDMVGESVSSVRCTTQSGIVSSFSASEYVFCLGAIESSRFFLQPRAGALPWNASGLLGKHFQDHIDCSAATVISVRPAAFHDLIDPILLDGYKYNPKWTLDRKTQRDSRILNVGATFFCVEADERLEHSKAIAKRMLKGNFGSIQSSEALNLVRHGPFLIRQAKRYFVRHRAYHRPDAAILMRVHCEQEPASSSAITLSRERDELGLFRARLSWHISQLELETIRRFVEVAKLAMAGVATVIPHPALMRADQQFIDACEDGFHHMGGMRMHASAQCGVVDADLKLHGVTNAYVCSSAVYPTSGFSNPTHTLLALAVRLSKHLAL